MNKYKIQFHDGTTEHVMAGMVEFPSNGSVVFSELNEHGHDEFLAGFSFYLSVAKIDTTPTVIESKKL